MTRGRLLALAAVVVFLLAGFGLSISKLGSVARNRDESPPPASSVYTGSPRTDAPAEPEEAGSTDLDSATSALVSEAASIYASFPSTEGSSKALTALRTRVSARALADVQKQWAGAADQPTYQPPVLTAVEITDVQAESESRKTIQASVGRTTVSDEVDAVEVRVVLVRNPSGWVVDGLTGAFDLTPTAPSSKATGQKPTEIAIAALKAFARPDLSYDAWWKGLSPYLSDQARAAYAGTDPKEVPIRKVGGPATVLDSGSTYVAKILVPSDGGPYTVIMSRESVGAPWRVEQLSPPDSGSGAAT